MCLLIPVEPDVIRPEPVLGSVGMHERQEHDFSGTDLRHVIVRGADLRGGGFTDCRLRGVDIWNVDIHADLQNVVINGVDIAPLIETELNRREPERAKMRPDDTEGFREAWAVLERRWAETVDRARDIRRGEVARARRGRVVVRPDAAPPLLRHATPGSAGWCWATPRRGTRSTCRGTRRRAGKASRGTGRPGRASTRCSPYAAERQAMVQQVIDGAHRRSAGQRP